MTTPLKKKKKKRGLKSKAMFFVREVWFGSERGKLDLACVCLCCRVQWKKAH